VTRHREHTARRGRIDTRAEPDRITRRRACPHPASTPAQPGHVNSPTASRRSTSAVSAPTVNTGASAHHRAALPSPGQRITGGPLPVQTSSQ
jgi:hypothetical protein